MEQGQREAGRFARAGLGAGHQVAALKNGGDRLGLDGGGGFVTLFAHGAQDGLGQAEIGEVHVF